MDDPWANAWGEPSKTSPHSLTSTSAWSVPAISTTQSDHDTGEGDLSLPSWSAQPTTTQWNDPDTSEALWTNDASTIWNPFTSTIDKGSSSPDSQSENNVSLSEPTNDVERSLGSVTPKDTIAFGSPTSTTSDTPPPPRSPQIIPTLPPALSTGPVDDLDAFGTFETANEGADSEDWSISRPGFSIPSADAAVWDGPWETLSAPTTSDAQSTANLDVDDAWEVARRQKEKQDEHVPPELLASILQQFESLSEDLWSDSTPSRTDALGSQLPTDMEEHLGLAPIVVRLVPEGLTLPVSEPFSKTFTSKQMSEALKMTRHTHLTRISPMTFYMSSKGLTSWEASVKAKPTFLQEDFTPAGWRILETQKPEASPADDGKKKSSGGLLSFFGRKTTNSPSDNQNVTAARSSSPINLSGTSSVRPGTSPRPSIDSSRRSISQSQAGSSTAPPSPSVVTFTTNTPPVSVKDVDISPEHVTATVVPAGSPDAEVVPQPSAVSRFLGRFSSRPSKSNGRDSLTLSSDDLEFLSDVPTVDTSPDSSMGLDALSMMIKSPPIQTALPPPLKPPPRAPPQISMPIPQENPPVDDFLSFFDNDNNMQPVPAQSQLPIKPVPTPLVMGFTTQALPTTTKTNSVNTSEQMLDFKGNVNQPWPSFDYPSSTPMKKPAPTKRPFVAIMSTSSSKPTSANPPLLPKPTSGFVLSNPPSLSRRTTVGSGPESRSISPLPPPPPSRAQSHLPPLIRDSVPPPPRPLTTTIEDDDFSEFLSSPSDNTQSPQLSLGNFTPSQPSLNQTTTHSTSNLFDDFDDFVTPPPQPPAKPIPPKSSFPLSRSPSVPKNANHAHSNHHKPIRVANHSKTLSLMENVAARGRWLAPPSPLPEALPPPEANGVSSTVDFFSSGSSMQDQQAKATASLTAIAAASSTSQQPPLLNFGPPPASNSTLLTPIPQSAQATFPPATKLQPFMTPLAAQPILPASNGTKTGGLSAQDLSFFEGL
ncbi:hypothetical protein JR316_0008087 [Psilocybe cubensis]|uniref:Uncharacterized protein n=2 Tax=Psilocybe cubensis TaxID=181762 RepID=A0ACB8GUT0_PSICU|nr:hypothetical protein JR316_0008087 [Psilocybe cubensis]KAH9479493.1 hypothetical protein JR316_0008087 [Psilocybe cubensis]